MTGHSGVVAYGLSPGIVESYHDPGNQVYMELQGAQTPQNVHPMDETKLQKNAISFCLVGSLCAGTSLV